MEDISALGVPQLALAVPGTAAISWHGLLRRGVGVFVDRALSMRDFMTQVLGMSSDYATNSVPGLFLNNAPVDDWDAEQVGGGDEVGMSGTMPGLCGIALRRSSPIRSFRPDLVSDHGEDKAGGIVQLRMFNFVARDCFPEVFAHGVIVSGGSLREYMADEQISLDDCECLWNGVPESPARVGELLAAAGGEIDLHVRMGEG